MICKECHHQPSGRDTLGVGRCYCKCHDVADAAPELLEACEAWVMFIESNAGCNPPLAFTREAIQKARGQ